MGLCDFVHNLAVYILVLHMSHFFVQSVAIQTLQKSSIIRNVTFSVIKNTCSQQFAALFIVAA